MKIVKFNNGKYGVRKWSWSQGQYVYAVNSSGCWSPKTRELIQEFDSLEYAEIVLDKIQGFDKSERDKGSPV